MPYINLLPWRENARREQQQQFIAILAGISGVVIFFVFVLNYFYSARLEGQEYRNNYLQSEISILDKRIREIRDLNKTKDNLNQRIKLIEELQSSRNLGTQVFNEIAAIVPAGVYLTKVEKKQGGLQITGKSESNNRLANMIRMIEQSALLYEAELDSIKAGNKEGALLSDFSMTVKVKGMLSTQGEEK
jgi:type IV pilus assembly protein PilN